MLAILAPNEPTPRGYGRVHVYRAAGGTFNPEQDLDPFPECTQGFYTGKLALDGDRIAVSAPADSHRFQGGSVLTFGYRSLGRAWVEEWRMTAEQEYRSREFGSGALVVQGPTVLVGSPGFINEQGIIGGALHVFDPSLGLEIRPNRVLPADSLTMRTCRGKPGTPALLFGIAFDDIPISFQLAIGTIGPYGDWVLNVPSVSPLSGHFIDLLTFGFNDFGKVQASNPERLWIH